MPDTKPAIDLTVRAATLQDAAAITRLANMPLYRRGTMRLPYQSEAETATFLTETKAGAINIVAEQDGAVVGNASLIRFSGRRIHAASIGLGVADHCQGQGIGTALLFALIDAADNWLNIQRLELTVFSDNEAALRLYRKAGFLDEGLLRGYAFRDGAYADVITMARLKAPRALINAQRTL